MKKTYSKIGREELPGPVKRSLFFILLSIAFWFIAYNAVETWFTTYASRMWGMSLGAASACLTVTAVGALISYIPAGILAEKVGKHGNSKPVSRKRLEAFDVDD